MPIEKGVVQQIVVQNGKIIQYHNIYFRSDCVKHNVLISGQMHLAEFYPFRGDAVFPMMRNNLLTDRLNVLRAW